MRWVAIRSVRSEKEETGVTSVDHLLRKVSVVKKVQVPIAVTRIENRIIVLCTIYIKRRNKSSYNSKFRVYMYICIYSN